MCVRELKVCNLDVVERPWQFAEDHTATIARNWSTRQARNPKLFNGDVFILDQFSINDGEMNGQVLPAKFASYLYWRDCRLDADRYREIFVLSVVISSDGGILLAQAVDGMLSEGLYGPPGGLLDDRDSGDDGRLDLPGAASREMREETGLTADEMIRQPGFLLAVVAPSLAITSVFLSALSGAELVDRTAGFLERQADPELQAPHVVYRASELDALPSTPFCRLLTSHILGM